MKSLRSLHLDEKLYFEAAIQKLVVFCNFLQNLSVASISCHVFGTLQLSPRDKPFKKTQGQAESRT